MDPSRTRTRDRSDSRRNPSAEECAQAYRSVSAGQGRTPECQLLQAKQICHKPVRTIRAGGQLPPQPEANVDPSAFADLRFHQRGALGPLVERERLREFYEIFVLRITSGLVEEIEPALLHPARPIGAADGIRLVEYRVLGGEEFHLGVLVCHALAADACRIRTVLRVVEL